MNGMQGHEYRGPHTLHERIERLERELAQRDALLANQKALILHLYKQLDEVKK